ncbi:hypothetical protein ACP70R_007369 [Stipagrostis hirtigluma subsp. patula]
MATPWSSHSAPGAPPHAPPHVDRSFWVGFAFTKYYYNVLGQSPDQVYRFYHDVSVIGRPTAAVGGAGMDFVSTLKGINAKIVKTTDMAAAEITAVDSHESGDGGIAVHVRGHITGRRGGSRRGFLQSFILAPQAPCGFFVRQDVLRYVAHDDDACTGHEQDGARQQEENGCIYCLHLKDCTMASTSQAAAAA